MNVLDKTITCVIFLVLSCVAKGFLGGEHCHEFSKNTNHFCQVAILWNHTVFFVRSYIYGFERILFCCRMIFEIPLTELGSKKLVIKRS